MHSETDSEYSAIDTDEQKDRTPGQDQDAESDGGLKNNRQYDLRPRREVKYTYVALAMTLSTCDEPTGRVGLRSNERTHCLSSSEEGFKTLRDNTTCTMTTHSSTIRPVPSG